MAKIFNVDELLSKDGKIELFKVIESRLNTANFKLSIEYGSNKGDNFMGEIFRVLCQDTTNSNNQTSLILKKAPRNLMLRQAFHSRDLFLREIAMYDQVLKYFIEFQQTKGVTSSQNGFYEFPKVYSSVSEDFYEFLVLEDLRLKDFELHNLRQTALTFEHMALAMKALGKFHAISFALKDQNEEKFQQLSGLHFEQYWTMFKSRIADDYEKKFNFLIDVLNEAKRYDSSRKLKEAAGNNYLETIYRLTSTDPYSVICHGDVTTNNSMFRKNDQGKPIEFQLFDWQFTRYASPVTDLVLYLLCSSTKELRQKHFREFLEIYHGSLSDLLKRLGSEPQKLFPFEVLLDQFKKFGVYAAFVGALLLPIFFADPETLSDFSGNPEEDEHIFAVSDDLKPEFNKRIVDMIDDMACFGYI